MYTKFYQWNRTTAWPATGSVNGGDDSYDPSETWTNNPCPAGWRLPTREEVAAMNANTNPSGGTCANANERGAAVTGRFYGPNHATCSLPNSMAGCIFLPASGYRSIYDSSSPYSQGYYGFYWHAMQYSSIQGSGFYFYCENYGGNYANNAQEEKHTGFSIRCVQ